MIDKVLFKQIVGTVVVPVKPRTKISPSLAYQKLVAKAKAK